MHAQDMDGHVAAAMQPTAGPFASPPASHVGWKARPQPEMADASSQYKAPATDGGVHTAQLAPDPVCDADLLALLQSRLQHGLASPYGVQASVRLPGHDDDDEPVQPRSPVRATAALPFSIMARSSRRQPAFTTVTPSSAVPDARSSTAARGSLLRAAALASPTRQRPQQNRPTAVPLQLRNKLTTDTASQADRSAHDPRTPELRSAAAQTQLQPEEYETPDGLSAERCERELEHKMAATHQQAEDAKAALMETLAAITAERDAAITAEDEVRRACESKARHIAHHRCTLGLNTASPRGFRYKPPLASECLVEQMLLFYAQVQDIRDDANTALRAARQELDAARAREAATQKQSAAALEREALAVAKRQVTSHQTQRRRCKCQSRMTSLSALVSPFAFSLTKPGERC